MWWPCDKLVEGGCGRHQRRRRRRKCNPSGRTDGARPRPRFYDGFQVIYDPGVPRVPTNGFTLYREQLREGDQLVLEHHEFDVSARPTIFYNAYPTNDHLYRVSEK
ncbi:hypothetical protein HZH66_009613 [Vespula vulgaris]|uniref:Uncharacterized protein n=1 Tax=Vespula vulgaris TaxID=7454 RepID=A0A834JM55_VESVU|nr:hypothetical protein HZH66_009613 [Vespula vulgaris]